MSFYERARENARRLISKFGVEMSAVTCPEAGDYDDSGNELVQEDPIEIKGFGVKLNYSLHEKAALSYDASAKILFWSEDVPLKGMFIEIRGSAFRIVKVETLEPAGENVMYTLHVLG